MWLLLSGNIGDGGASRVAFPGNQVQRLSFYLRQYGRVWFINKTTNRFSQPVIATGLAVNPVHTLLNHGP